MTGTDKIEKLEKRTGREKDKQREVLVYKSSGVFIKCQNWNVSSCTGSSQAGNRLSCSKLTANMIV